MNDAKRDERTVLILVPEEGLLFEAAGIADIFQQANILGAAPRPYRFTIATSLKHRVIRGRSGLCLMADATLTDLDPRESRDTLIVTGAGAAEEENEAIADWLRLAAPQVRRVVSVCKGAFLLARAGLLDGRKATTHWKAADEMERTFPRVTVEKDKIYVRDGPIWTSAGASAGFDLALALVEEDLGAGIAREVARHLVLFLRRPGGQSQFSAFLDRQALGDGPVRAVQDWAIEHLDQDLSVERLAERAAMSPRNFARIFSKETGIPPARYVELLRVEAARQRLEQGDETMDQVASACGLGTALTLRRTFERQLRVTPSDYRNRFGMN